VKIVHITEAWNGGIASYVNMLIAAHGKKHCMVLFYDPALASHGFNADLYETMGVELVAYESSRHPLKALKIARYIREKLRDIAPDIVHLHSSFPGVYGRFFRLEFPCIYCAHGWSFLQEDSAAKRLMYQTLEMLLARRCDGIVHISEFESRHAQNRGVIAKHNRVILNGALGSLKRAPAPEPRAKGKIRLGFVGRDDYKKGFDILQRYMRENAAEHVHLTAIGIDAQNEDNITYLGWVDADQLDAHYQHFDLVVMPSRYEGFGLVALEAMRNGIAIIGTKHTALSEIIRDGETGFLIDLNAFNAEMSRILNHVDADQAGRLAVMGSNALSDFEARFTARRMADEIMAFYEEVSA